MAQSGTIAQVYNSFRDLAITITGVTNGNTCVPFQSQGFPFGSVMVVVAAGTAPTGVQLQGSNDGVNFANLGAAATAFPALAPLTVNDESPALWYQFLVTGGDGTTRINASILLAGSKA